MRDTYEVDRGISFLWTSAYRWSRESDFARKVAMTFTTRVLLVGAAVVTNILVARTLGPAGRGLFAVALAIGTIGVQFGDLGLCASNTYYVSRDKSQLPFLMGNSLFVAFGVGGGCAVLTWILFSIWPGVAPVGGGLLLMALSWIPLGIAFALLQNLLIAIDEVRAYSVIELVNKVATLILVVLVVLAGVASAEIVFAAGLFSLTACFGCAIMRLRGHLERGPRPSTNLFRENIGYGLKAYFATALAFLVLRADLFMVKYMLGASQAGHYSIAVAMADAMCMLPLVVGALLFPKLCSLDDRRRKLRLTVKVSACMAVAMAVLAGAGALLAKPVIVFLFDRAYLPSVAAFVWLMPGMFFLGVESVAVKYLSSIGFPRIVVWIWLFVVVLTVAVNLWVIPRFGIVGASAVSSVSYMIVFILVISVIVKVARADE